MKQHLLLIEDDERLGALVSEYLTDAGFDITHVLNAGDVALRYLILGSRVLGDICTYPDEDRFFSYRRTTHRQEPDYGRQISAIMIRG